MILGIDHDQAGDGRGRNAVKKASIDGVALTLSVVHGSAISSEPIMTRTVNASANRLACRLALGASARRRGSGRVSTCLASTRRLTIRLPAKRLPPFLSMWIRPRQRRVAG